MVHCQIDVIARGGDALLSWRALSPLFQIWFARKIDR
jgi:hypothetical protein